MVGEPGHDRALPRDPAISDEDTALAVTLETEQRWMELVKLIARQADAVAPGNKAAYHLRVAEIYQDRFANQAEAIKAYERVLEHDRGHRKAIEQLCALYEKRRDWEKYFELQKGELERLPAEQQRDRAVELARLAASRIAKPDVTIYWWQRVLDFEPDHRQAIAELSKSFERAERWMELTTVLEQQISLAPGNDERVSTLARLATVRGEQLRDLEGARAAWQQLLDIEPEHTAARAALRQLDHNPPVTRAPSNAPSEEARAPSSAATRSALPIAIAVIVLVVLAGIVVGAGIYLAP